MQQPTYPYQLPLGKVTSYVQDFVPQCVSKKV